jgi:sigma-B regulation protein RsbU (phosphoserine phosphatase)
MSSVAQAVAEPLAPAEHRIKVLLIDDQRMVGEAVRRMLAEDPAIDYRYCQDPKGALEEAETFEPTVILQDLVMPDIDGITMVKMFRASPKTEPVPLIVLSSKEEATTKAEAFGAGANDYLVKLPDKIELLARIRHHSRAHINRLQRDEAFAALQEQQRVLTQELAEAAEYVGSLLPGPLKNDRGISADWRFIPSTSLGGDTFSYLWLDERRFCLTLLDVCGHGVGAALLSVSVIHALRSRHALGQGGPPAPAEMLAVLNKAFPMENNNQMYFTMWFGIYDTATRELTYASGGHPPAILIGPDGSATQLLTPGLMVGALAEAAYSQKTVTLPANARLYLFSDGCYEVKRQPENTLISLEDFVAILKTHGQDLDRVIGEIRTLQAKPDFVDDFSLVEFKFD